MKAQFVYAWVLYLLWVVPAVALWWAAAHRRRERRLAAFLSPAMQGKLRPAHRAVRFVWQIGLVSAGLLFLLAACARPQWGTREETVYRRGRDLVIALDVSRSMLARDVRPNRLGRAKADLLDLISELRGDRAALVAFRHKAVLLCPLTTDYAYLRQALDAASMDSAPAGETDLGDAVRKALDAFESEEGSHKAIILISDGEDLTGGAQAAAGQAAERNIPIFTVGIGDRRGARIPDPDSRGGYLTHEGKTVQTRLRHDTLLAIAQATPRGAYVPVETASTASITLGSLYRNHLRSIAEQDLEETLQRRYVERYQWLLLPGFLLLVGGAFLSRGRLAAGPRPAASAPSPESPPAPPLRDLNPPPRSLKTLVVLLALGLTVPLRSNAAGEAPADADRAPPGREGARRAQQLYRAGRYEEAARTYLEAAQGATRKSQDDFRYNAAAALFAAGAYRQAADLLRSLTAAGPRRRAEWQQGLGAALYRQAGDMAPTNAEQYAEQARVMREAGEAFRESARVASGEAADRENLAVVLDALPGLEEQARITKLLEKHQATPAPALAEQMLAGQRRLLDAIPRAFTNHSPARIRQLEELSAEQKANADLWIPLKSKWAAAQGGRASPPDADAWDALVESTRESMLDAAEGLRNLDPAAYRAAVLSENGVYQLWKGMASYSQILEEDLRRQTNAIRLTVKADDPSGPAVDRPYAEQAEALELTRIFTNRFSAAVPPAGLPPPADPSPAAATNKADAAAGGLSPEARRQILDLARQAGEAQTAARTRLEQGEPAAALADERRSCELLRQIQDLLPKQSSEQPSSGAGQDQPKQQEPPQEPDEQERSEAPPSEAPPAEQPPPPSEEPGQPPPEPTGEEEGQSPPPEQEEMTEEEIRQLLERALEREKEHEAEKRRRERRIRLTPLDRDW